MKYQEKFTIIAMTPSGLSSPAIAIAACRAGGVGVLDLEYTNDELLALNSFEKLSRFTDTDFGIKLGKKNIDRLEVLTENLPHHFRILILPYMDKIALSATLAIAKKNDLRVLVECVTLAQAQSAAIDGADGVIAKGNESGGLVGHETTFILVQQFLRHLSVPIYAQGGIGLLTACACRAAGASGVVLDNQLLLTRECTIADTIKTAIRNFDGSETSVIGETLMRPFRVCHRLGKSLVTDLKKREFDLINNKDEVISLQEQWDREISDCIGWQSTNRNILFLGQDVALAHPLAESYVTVGGIIQAMNASVDSRASKAAAIQTLNENSPLAKSHNTRFPIVQGPMAQISDTPEFIEQISREGALPFFAVSWLRADRLETLLKRTCRLLKGRPWGVGLLGFLPSEVYNEQLNIIKAYHPPFAMIAGGRPDQIEKLEQSGIATYVHATSPALLKIYLNHGARRFVFEGRESGGHVGPRNSFLLWEQLIETFFENIPPGQSCQNYHILFAGGIHDDLSAAMISVIAHSLSESGVRVGVQLGSAYLFTAEAVQSGAMVKDYQERILASDGTVILEMGGGHANRCIDNPFARSFLAKRHALLASGSAPAQIREILEKMTVGRLRIAAKGVTRDSNSSTDNQKRNKKYRNLGESERWQEGMYMIGQLAAIQNEVKSISALHRNISFDSQIILTNAFGKNPTQVKLDPVQAPSDIAIVGMACALPGASTLNEYWENILMGIDNVREVPIDRWDSKHYYSQNPHEKDKVYSKWGAFINPILFDPIKFAIPPTSIHSIEPLQLIALQIASDALADAGYAARPFKRQRTSVIFGISGTAELGQLYSFRSTLPTFLGKDAEVIISHFDGILPEWTEDSFPGILMNVTAGRIANRLDLGGTNYTVDAACASSLAAVHLGVKELESRTSDIVIVGGADTMQNPFTFLCFSKTHALSPSGNSRPLDQSADGIVIGEGVVSIVLKRLSDAKRDGDRIYAIIKGTGAASDGRDKSLTAPHPDGQIRALERTYAKANFSPATLSLVEAHATATTVGDKTEIEALNTFLIRHQTPTKACAVGSVKSMIGHTKSAAGIASIAKVALSLYHKTLPPSLHVNNPIVPLDSMESPLYVNTCRRPWLKNGNGHPRRAGVSAFGFGGTNFHVAIEENSDYFCALPSEATFRTWPSEVFIWQQKDLDKLIAQIRIISDAVRHNPQVSLSDLAFSVNQPFVYSSGAWDEEVSSVFNLAIVATSQADLAQKIKTVQAKLNDSATILIDKKGIYFSKLSASQRSKIAFLFPGQGSQYVNMMADLPIQFPQVRKTIEQSDAILRNQLHKPLSAYIYPPPSSDKAIKGRYDAELRQSNIAQSAMGTMDLAVFRLLKDFGVFPDMVAGHSYGEYVALYAAGVISAEDLILLSEARGRFIMQAEEETPGTMAAINADVDTVTRNIQHIANLVVANVNAPEQTVVSGTNEAVAEAVEHFNGIGHRAYPIPVSGPLHSPLIAPAGDQLSDYMKKVNFSAPRFDVYSNVNAAPYPSDPRKISEQLVKHMIDGVKFVDQIEAMYGNGARIFVECGPKNVLSGLVNRILGERPYCMINSDAQEQSALNQICHILGILAAHGVKIRLEKLYRGRSLKRIDFQKLSKGLDKPKYSSGTLLVNGAKSTPIDCGHDSASETFNRVIEPMMLPVTAVVVNTGSDTVSQEDSSPQSDLIPKGEQNHVIQKSVMENDQRDAFLKEPAAMGREAATMSHFQQIMSKFLETQNKVMNAYFSNNTSTMESVVKAPPANKEKLPGTKIPNKPSLDSHAQSVASPKIKYSKPQTKKAKQATAMRSDPSHRPITGFTAVQNPLSVDFILPILLKIVEDRTGYPEEILNLDQHLESDYGIDSIKRIEILSSLMEEIPAPFKQTIADKMEKLSGLKTMREIVQWIVKQPSDVSDIASISKVPDLRHETLAPEQLGAAPPVQRSIIVTEPLPGLIGNTLKPPNGVFIITEDRYGIANKIAEKLNALQIMTVVVFIGETVNSLTNGHCKARLDSSEDAARLLKMIRSKVGPVCGLIHLSPLDERRMKPRMDTDNWRGLLQKQAKQLFLLAKEIAKDLDGAVEKGTACLIAATAMGEISGDRRETDNPIFYPGQAGIAGLLKCLAIEWPRLNIKAIDFPVDASTEEIVDPLMAEMATDDKVVQIKYRNGKRLCLKPQIAPLSTESAPCLCLNDKWVILVTGGARGITFEVSLELAKQYQAILLLVGLSPLPPLEETPDTVGLTDAKSIKAALIAREQTSGKEFAIAQVEKAYHRLIKEREIRRNLEAIKKAGSKFEYFNVDVADPRAFGALIDQIYRTYNRLDGVIHGAGIIEDKLIRDKTPESFERVFDTKVAGGFALSRKLRFESLKFLVFFTSVAGIFGNRGQSDYAAANEVLNKLALYLDARWPTRVVGINWGPWAKKGMVTDALKKQFAQKGVTMIPPQVGTRKMMEELCYGRKGNAELIIGGMNWSAGFARETAPPFYLFPLLKSGMGALQKSNARNEAIKQFDLHHDLYLRDHVLDGKPVLPAAMAMELLTEFAKLQVPNLSLAAITDFRVMKGIVIENSHQDIRLTAEVTADEPELKHYAVRLINTRNSQQVYYSAEVKFGRHTEEIEDRPLYYPVPMQSFPFTIQEAYNKWLFHGPTFKGINEIQGSSSEGIRAWVIPSSPYNCLSDAEEEAWLIDPVVIDCIFQLHIIWAREYRDMTSLPTYIKSYKQLRPLSGEKIDCQIKITNASTGGSIIQSEIGLFDQSGDLLGIMNGCESTCSKSLNRLSENKCKV